MVWDIFRNELWLPTMYSEGSFGFGQYNSLVWQQQLWPMELQPRVAQPFLALPSAYVLSPIPYDLWNCSLFFLDPYPATPNPYCSHSQYIPSLQSSPVKTEGPSRSRRSPEGPSCAAHQIPSFPPQRADAPAPDNTQHSQERIPFRCFRADWATRTHTRPPRWMWQGEEGRPDGTGGDAGTGTCPVLLPPGCAASPKRSPFPNHPHVPAGAISSRRLTVAEGFCLQPNTQKC